MTHLYNSIAQSEFGMDYDQLGPNEKEWVEDECYTIRVYGSCDTYDDDRVTWGF